jgi:type I restriction enzyme S subunit
MEGCSFVPEAVANAAPDSWLSKGDILVSMTGYIGEIGRVRTEESLVLNQRVGKFSIIDPDRLDADYFYYVLQQDRLKAEMQTHAYGAAQPNISPSLIHNLTIPLPPLPTQRKIADILSAYDDLIENNTRRIAILEEMAQRLYQEWFVHFRYPGHEEVPLVDSELGPIPEGWRVLPLGSACDRISSGGTPSRREPTFWSNPTIPWFKTKELQEGFLFGSEESISEVALSRSSARLFEPGTILMAIYAAPTVGRLGIVTEPSSCNQAALGLVGNPAVATQSYLFYKRQELRPEFNRSSQGAAQQNISKEKVAATRAVFPPIKLLRRFDSMVVAQWSMIKNLSLSNLTASEAKASLLPRLVSGTLQLDRTL